MPLSAKPLSAAARRRAASHDAPSFHPAHTQCVPLGTATARQSAGRRFAPGAADAAPRVVVTAARRSGQTGSQGSKDVVARAVASPDAPTAVAEKSFPLRNDKMIKLSLETTDAGDQLLLLQTDLDAGKLLLHWGVEGGRDYKGGWRLPGGGCRPEGTVQYKDRALQSPFRFSSKSGMLELRIELRGDEASDVLNFVLKDDATNSWWDNNGSNFVVSLRGTQGAATADDDDGDDFVLDKNLCDKWAWVRWDVEGRRTMQGDDAARHYDTCVEQMRALMAAGRPAEELWQVANGAVGYTEYCERNLPGFKPPSAPAPQQGPIPGELLGVQAYLLWEKAGKPDGADFSQQARQEIERQVKQGMTYAQIEAKIKQPAAAPQEQKQQQPKQQQQAAPQEEEKRKDAPPPEKAKAQASSAEVGKPLDGKRSRNPLDLIKRRASSAPKLSAEERPPTRPMDFLIAHFTEDPGLKWKRRFNMTKKAELVAVVRHEDPAMPVRVDVITDLADGLVLHWGINKPKTRNWSLPPEELWPEETIVGGPTACDTELLECNDEECDVEVSGSKVPLQRATIWLPPDHTVAGISFVARSKDKTMWYKDGDRDFFVPVPGRLVEALEEDKADPLAAMPDDLTREIVNAEVNSSQWTLMHRFNKATDLLNEVLAGNFESIERTDAMAYIYVWLRYSAIRQLTWQRNYNTQPRILSAAQDRLTGTITHAHKNTTGEAQEWVRAMLSTVGRGGDGQKIRDEILHIMHRNHISESKGHWMEEWHQKLHNNTTPDDVPICEAYIKFLEGGGNMQAYWSTLSDAGLTRERLESFDRPVKSEPQTYGKEGALIPEMRNYLGILKSVHSGADLQSSAKAAGGSVPEGARGFLGYVMSHIGSHQILPLMEAAVEARAELASALPGNRELVYLDLALEDQVRQAAERGIGPAGFGAAAFMKPLLQNLCLSLGDNEELCYCLKTWQELPASARTGGRPSKEEALQAVAVLNRIRRAISDVSDRVVARIGHVSKTMGEACGAENWASELFAEEVVRGGPAFAVSLVISSVEPELRSAASLGAWQVISPSPATGVIEVVHGLDEVQDKTYSQPTVLVAEQVTGEEEIPDGCVGVLTPDAPDVLSHVSVRARNMHVLFATCHDDGPLDEIRAMKGKTLAFKTTASGAVSYEEAKGSELADEKERQASEKRNRGLKIEVPRWSGKWTVMMDDYDKGVVGAKSRNLASLRGRLPANIKLPASVTLPFGCFEEVLELPENRDIKSRLRSLVGTLNAKPKQSLLESMQSMMSMDGASLKQAKGSAVDAAAVLAECREVAMQVTVPDSLRSALADCMSAAGVPPPNSEQRWSLAMEALKGVWASKYNDRAYYSLRKVDLNFDDVRMAVLVQAVVPAKYAFVIHTKNPSNNDETEVFCELVQGLGESLVSGMIPGSSIAFRAKKDSLDNPEILCYASKSEGMFVPESLIFRSDSNGEDLEGYAGAGLYESITMDTTETRRVDYMDDPLVQDPEYRKHILSEICKVGAAIETALGSAQDIEGVVAPDNSITVVQTRPQV